MECTLPNDGERTVKPTSKLISFGLALLVLTASAYAQSPREQLQQLVEQLQRSPGDDGLRVRLITLALTIRPLPATPDEAERRMIRGRTAFLAAKSAADYQDAAKEFEQAALAAPWYGDAYFNLGLSQYKAERYEAALRSLKLAQLVSPDSREIKTLIYEVEYRQEKSNSPEAKAAREKDAERRGAAFSRGLAERLVAELRSLYSGYVSKVLYCGVKLNQYWMCTENEANGSNWVDSSFNEATRLRSFNPVQFKVVDRTNTSIIYFSAGPQGPSMGFVGCGILKGITLNEIEWTFCDGPWAGKPLGSVAFETSTAGKPFISFIYSCGGDGRQGSCRREQLVFN